MKIEKKSTLALTNKAIELQYLKAKIAKIKVKTALAVMRGVAEKLKMGSANISSGLLAGQMLFAVAFVGTCEVPNFMTTKPQSNACLERWMAVSALFIPSGLSEKAPAAPKSAPRSSSTTRRTSSKPRTSTTRSATEK